uniref:Uncharacterized protein n=1 Tax=Cynoglossus semilaevis TaxID=244447 RepID=A0A3P8UIU0_CYNSE
PSVKSILLCGVKRPEARTTSHHEPPFLHLLCLEHSHLLHASPLHLLYAALHHVREPVDLICVVPLYLISSLTALWSFSEFTER